MHMLYKFPLTIQISMKRLLFCEIPATKDMVFALAYKGDTEYSLSLNIVFEEPETLEIS